MQFQNSNKFIQPWFNQSPTCSGLAAQDQIRQHLRAKDFHVCRTVDRPDNK
jgi:hypothetical protein